MLFLALIGFTASVATVVWMALMMPTKPETADQAVAYAISVLALIFIALVCGAFVVAR